MECFIQKWYCKLVLKSRFEVSRGLFSEIFYNHVDLPADQCGKETPDGNNMIFKEQRSDSKGQEIKCS